MSNISITVNFQILPEFISTHFPEATAIEMTAAIRDAVRGNRGIPEEIIDELEGLATDNEYYCDDHQIFHEGASCPFCCFDIELPAFSQIILQAGDSGGA